VEGRCDRACRRRGHCGRDLPSFPSVGISNKDATAGAAATLANRTHKPFEPYRPDSSASAGKAAMLAKDYKMQEVWKPELSTAGSKAALLAAREGPSLSTWDPESTLDGHSAAEQAMRKKALSPDVHHGNTEDGSKRALLAAKGAMSGGF
jgi:hypothetical protein